MKTILRGWDEIAAYLDLHPRTAQQYERRGILRVHRPSGGGPKAPVYAFREELEDWIRRRTAATDADICPSDRRPSPIPDSHGILFARLLDEIIKARDTTFYRRNYFLKVALTRSVRGVQAKIECEFELFNATSVVQPYVQEVTIDDRDEGYVERLAVFANGTPLYTMRRPAITQKFRGYAVYHGSEVMIRPIARGVVYVCRASWLEHHGENDLWYNHMGMPTIGVEVETHAPPEFDITPPYSSSDLLMTAQHIDIAWNRRK